MSRGAARPTLAFVPVRYYEALHAFVRERGHSDRALLEGTGLTSARLADPTEHLSIDEVEAFVLRAWSLEPGDDVALEVGKRFQLLSHGEIGVAAISAPDIAAAIGTLIRYFPLVSPLFAIETRTEGETIALRLRARWPLDPRVDRFHLSTMVGSVYVQGALLLGHRFARGVAIDARHPRPPNLPSWVDETGVTVAFERPDYELRFPAAFATLRMPLADARTHAAACRACDALLRAAPDPLAFASLVRRRLERRGPPFADLETIAGELEASSRTVRRRLEEEGTSFRAILEEVRLARADELLARGDRSITEIGHALGYADAANFTRAYRRGRGAAPSVLAGPRKRGT